MLVFVIYSSLLLGCFSYFTIYTLAGTSYVEVLALLIWASVHRLRGSWQRAYAFGVINLQRHSYCILAETFRLWLKKRYGFTPTMMVKLKCVRHISVCQWWSMLIWNRMRISSPPLGAHPLFGLEGRGAEQGVLSGSWVLNRLYNLTI